MYQVLARKWRPQTFADLVGQPDVARALTNAIRAKRWAHAYVFAGLRGTGKTTVARILAKCLNCESGPTTEPCGRCAPCQEIAESQSIDVLEIDAASRTKVDQMRELMEFVAYAPTRDRNKVLIIDEAHMLSKNSFNALLKTLEEPPPNVVFILATTELHKVLPTILSRCQVFEFRRVGPAEVSRHLRHICDTEGLRISDPSLERIARAGEGSVRDALSLLERLLALCGQEIADDDVLHMLGAVRGEVVVALFEGLAAHDAGAVLTLLDTLIDEGHDLIHFWSEIVTAVRDLLVLRALPGRTELLTRPPEEAQALGRAAEALTREDLTRVFQILADLEPGLKMSSQPRFLFEAALIRLTGLGTVRPIEEVLESLGGGTRGAPRPSASPPAAQEKKSPDAVPLRSAAQTPRTEVAAPAASPAGGVSREQLITAIAAERPMIASFFEHTSAIALSGDTLTVFVPPGMEAIQRQIEQRESLKLLAQVAERLVGRRVVVRVELRAETDEPQPDGGAAGGASAGSGRSDSSLMEDARNDPGVRMLLDAFGARVVDIRRPDTTGGRRGRADSVAPAEDLP